MSRNTEGLHSDALLGAVGEAIAGRPALLEDFLTRHGGVLTPKPNYKLAAAFGVEIGGRPGPVARLLTRLASDDAAPDTDRVFLPIAAAHGWAGRIRAGLDVDAGWAALGDLGADERAPVRTGCLDALLALAAASDTDGFVTRAAVWLDDEERERRFGTAALAADVLADRRVMAGVRDPAAVADFLSRALAEVADASRSAERSDARRRLLAALPKALAAFVTTSATREEGVRHLEAECQQAFHPDVRRTLSDAILALRGGSGPGAAVIESLRQTLAAGAKPLRDPTRLRPGSGRGKASRRIR